MCDENAIISFTVCSLAVYFQAFYWLVILCSVKFVSQNHKQK